MAHITKKNCRLSIFYLALVSLAAFIIYYLPLIYDLGTAFIYISYFSVEFINSAIPLTSAAVLVLATANLCAKSCFLKALPFTLIRLPYLIPYYYCKFVVDYYDSVEAIFLAIFYSILLIILFYFEIILYSFVIRRVLKKKSESCSLYAPIFDVDAPVTYAVAICAFIRFAMNIAKEIYNAVIYFIDFSGTYKLSEILYIILCFILVLVFAILSHALACFVKNKLYNKETQENIC